MSQQEVEELQRQLEELRREFAYYLRQCAVYGQANLPSDIARRGDDLREKIQNTKQTLRMLGASVEGDNQAE